MIKNELCQLNHDNFVEEMFALKRKYSIIEDNNNIVLERNSRNSTLNQQ
jgi:hypothetical protein